MSGTVSLRPVSGVVSLLCFAFGVLSLLMTVAVIPNIPGMVFFFVVTCASIGAGISIQEQSPGEGRKRSA